MYSRPGRFLTLLPVLGLLLGVASAQEASFPDGIGYWDQFAPEPLTIISPDSTSVSNPPFLHWQDQPGADSYTVTLSGDGESWSWETEWNFYTPNEGVEPGEYTVEVEARQGGNTILGKSELTFLINKAPDGLDYGLNSLSLTSGAPVGWSDEQIQAIISADGAMVESRKKLLESARQPCYKTIVDPQEPERYPGAVWDWATWNANNSVTGAMQDRVSEQLLAWKITGEEQFAEEAKRLVLVAASWDGTAATGVWENDHSAHAILRMLALGYSFLGDQLSNEERALVRSAIATRAEDMYAFLNPFVTKNTSAGAMNDPDNNHAWFCSTALALGALALGSDDPRANEWAAFAAQMYRGVFIARGDAKGGWHEGNDYWSYMLFFVFQFTDAMDLATGIDFLQHPWLKNTGTFALLAHPPEGCYVPFANTKHKPPTAFDKMVTMRLASKFQDPMLWKYVNSIDKEFVHTRDVQFSLLWGDDDPPESDESFEFPFAVYYEDMGWVISNPYPFDVNKQTIFAFRAGPFAGRSAGHLHADQNHFILTAGEDKLLWDAGYYDGYLSPHNRNYSRLSDAHNTILVDGVGQLVQIAGLNAEITHFEQSDNTLTVTGDASTPLLYDGRVEQFLRTISYDLDNRRLDVKDTITLKEPGEISFLLHSAHPIVFRAGDHTVEVHGRDHQLEAQFVSDIPFRAIVTDTFTVPPKRPEGKENEFPEQYHLELRTMEKVQHWEPKLHARWWATGQPPVVKK